MTEFNIPNQEKELEEVSILLNKVYLKLKPLEKKQKEIKSLKRCLENKTLDEKEVLREIEISNIELENIKLSDEEYEKTLDLITNLLYKLGDLSIPVFEAREKIETSYFKKYKNSPALGKSLYLKEYSKFHFEYDRLKNKAFRLINIINPMPEEDMVEEEI